MSAVLRLLWTYFTANSLLRWLAGLGFPLMIVGSATYTVFPLWTLGTGIRDDAMWYQTVLMTLPWCGLIFLLSATALMPGIVERMSLGRAIWILPGGRLRVLCSTLLLAALLALLTATSATLAFYDYPIEISLSRIFFRTLLMAFVDIGLIYAAIWLVGKNSGVWRLRT